VNLGELLSSHENLEAVLDSLTDAIIAHDVERKVTVFNRAAERLTGLKRQDVLGKDCHDIFPGGFCGSRCAFCGVCSPACREDEYPVVVTDSLGNSHQVETKVVSVRNREGKVVGVVAATRDVTELTQLRERLQRERSFQGIIGKHHRIQEVYELVRQVAPADVPVLIQGESGTGKELCARAIHDESPRAAGPFVAVNCGALPEGLLESELFGHVKGAFTGAVRDKKGRFSLAHGGTLFLDEVGELTAATQVKLLRVLQEKRFEPVGAENAVDVDVRIVSATNRQLREMVRQGDFREDLFFRLCVVPIQLPPLRSRGTDVLLLADHFLARFATEMGRSQAPALSETASRSLLDYRWPGNIRELINALQYALVTSSSNIIEPTALPAEVTAAPPLPRLRRQPVGRKRKLTAQQVQEALAQASGNRVQAAKILGVGRSTLYRYLDESPS
jgi:PAS domain S-box-containing protein